MVCAEGRERIRDVAVARVMRRQGSPRPELVPDTPAHLPVLKTVDEMRFTLAPLYAPDLEDAHGEYVEARDLQDAVHDYMRAGDLKLRLMHQDGSEAEEIGQVVEMFTLPWSIEVPMLLPDGTSEDVQLPAGTVLTGTVWSERAWPAVKDGRLGGLSLGGRAVRARGGAVPDRKSLEGTFIRVTLDGLEPAG